MSRSSSVRSTNSSCLSTIHLRRSASLDQPPAPRMPGVGPSGRVPGCADPCAGHGGATGPERGGGVTRAVGQLAYGLGWERDNAEDRASPGQCHGRDLDGNAGLIVEWTRRAAARGARVVVFPEMMLTGYPVEDLALRASFVEASIAALHAVAARLAAEGLGGIAVVTGYLDRRADLAPRTGLPAGAPLDAAALLHGGRVVITSAKHHLPNYGVFDEFRYFVPGNTLPVFRLPAEAAPARERRDRHRDLRGPVAGRRPGGGLPARRRGAARGAERLALRARQGRRAAGPGGAAGPRGQAPRWPTPTWSAARTSWSSTATRSWSRPTAR